MRKSSIPLILPLFLLISCSGWKSIRPVPENQRFPANFQSCFDIMNSMIKHKNYSFVDQSYLANAQNLNELENAYGNQSLIDLQRKISNTEIQNANIHVKKLLNSFHEMNIQSDKTSFVTINEAQLILDAITNSKVNKNHYCYDPDNKTGFCFGRAIIGHMEALARGVNPDAVKKIWIAGDMKEWGHHVAPMVKAKEGWLVLDTNIGRPVTTGEWIKYYQPFKAAKGKDIMVFVTQPGRFGPDDAEAYSGINLFNTYGNNFDRETDFYKGYFHDYFEALDNDKSIQKFPIR